MTLDRSSSFTLMKNERGAAAVEFALILPVLLMLVFGIFAFGQFYSSYQVFQGAVREGARSAAARETPAQVRSRITDAADPYEISGPISISVGSGGSQCTMETVGQSVTVQWIETFDITLPFVPSLDFDRSIKGVFRCE